jgi:hypothetical protein
LSPNISQFAAVVFSGITPILILLDNTPKFVQAIPPAIASISAGLAVYNWRASGVRSTIALASLESERLHYELRVGTEYGSERSEEEALASFRKQSHANQSWDIAGLGKGRFGRSKQSEIFQSRVIENFCCKFKRSLISIARHCAE